MWISKPAVRQLVWYTDAAKIKETKNCLKFDGYVWWSARQIMTEVAHDYL